MLKRDLLVNYFGYAWSALMSMAFLPLYIKYLGIEAYGLVGIYVSLQGWFALLDMGFSPTLNREMARYTAGLHTSQSINTLFRSMEVVFLWASVAICALVAGLSPWIARGWLNFNSLSVHSVTQALAITGAIIGLRWMVTLYRSALFGLHKQVWINVSNMFFATLRGAGAVGVLFFVSPTILAFFCFQVFAAALEAGVLLLKLRAELPTPPEKPRFEAGSLKGIRTFAAGMTVITIFATLMTQADKLILSKLLSLEQFGYYTLTVTIATVVTTLTVPLTNVALPTLNRLVPLREERTLARQYHLFSQVVTIGVVPVSLVISVFARPILMLWTRNPALSQAVSPILTIWIIGAALNGLTTMPYLLQVANGYQRIVIVAYGASVAVMVPCLILFAPSYGPVTAAWTWVTINLAYLFLAVPLVHRRFLPDELSRWYLLDVLLPSSVAGCVVATGFFVYGLFERISATGTIVLLFACTGLAIALSALVTAAGRNAILGYWNLTRRGKIAT